LFCSGAGGDGALTYGELAATVRECRFAAAAATGVSGTSSDVLKRIDKHTHNRNDLPALFRQVDHDDTGVIDLFQVHK
jgi:hypothetical protein